MSLDDAWNARWGVRGVRPIGHELRTTASDTWVRFHSLPNSYRYAYDDDSAAEVLRRHNTLIGELVATSASPDVLVFTCAWSDGEAVVPRHEPLAGAIGGAAWTSVALGGVTGWTHVYAEALVWEVGAIDPLLVLVGDDTTADVIVAPADLSWLYHPYDGGCDVIAVSKDHRAELRARHRDWLSPHASGL